MATIETRRASSGKTVFRAKVRLKGAKAVSGTFARITDARRWVQKAESEIREGRYFPRSEAKRRTVCELLDRYERECLPHKSASTQRNQKTQLAWWRKELGDLSLFDLTPPRIVEKRDYLLHDGSFRRSPATVVRYLAVLSHALGLAVREWQWLSASPMPMVSKPKEPRGRARYLTAEERRRLFSEVEKASNPYLRSIVLLAITTGARKNEILQIRWEDVHLERGCIEVHETKNGERKNLHLIKPVSRALAQLFHTRRQDTDLVFPSHKGCCPIDIRRPWMTLLKRANIIDFRFHDLRHSCASYLAMSGATSTEIASVLGHRTLTMVKRYSHISETHNRDVVNRMADFFLETLHEPISNCSRSD